MKKGNRNGYVLRRHLHMLLLCLLTCLCHEVSAQEGRDSAIAILLRTAKDSLEENPELSVALAQKAYEKSEARREKKNVVLSLNVKGAALHQLGKLREAIEVFNSGLIMTVHDTMKSSRADILLNLGMVYENQGDYKNAMQQYENALSIFTVLKDTMSIGNCYHNMGVLALHMNSIALSRKYFLLAVQMYTAMHDPNHIAGAYMALGGTYISDSKYKEGLRYFIYAQKISDSIHNDESSAIGNMNIALGYQELQKKDSAMIYYKRAQEFFNTLNTTSNEVLLYVNMGTLYDEIGQKEKAKECYKLALQLATEINYTMGIGFAYGNLADIYKQLGNYKDAYKYLELHMVIKDTLLNREKLSALEEMAAKYQTRELDDRNKLLQKENDLQKLRLRNKDLLIYSGFGVALLSLVIGIQMVRQNKLRAARQKLELEQKQLQAQMNPHFIFNCLNSIQQFVLQNDRANANKYLADFALLMRQTLDNSRDGTITLHREIEYLKNYLSFEHMRFEDKFICNVHCAADINPYTTEIPSMLIQPFAENAIKHGLCNMEDGGGVLDIRFYKRDNSLYCEVDDNGIGIKEAQKLKENNGFITHQSRGVELTRQRLALATKMHSGDYTISIIDKAERDNKTGTIVIIKFPLYA